MKTISLFTTVISYILISCLNPIDQGEIKTELVNPAGTEISTRFLALENCEREKTANNSFENYLQNLPLKPTGSIVNYYNGETKSNQGIYCGVVDLEIGSRDLHQCADAIIRLRAEYFFNAKNHTEIAFNFTNGFRAEWARWKKGDRISVNGNSVSWKPNSKKPSDSYQTFWSYLEMVFSYAGTASLEKELTSTELSDIKIGDVFIQGGFPGHAVIIVDICENKETKEKFFMLAQSYMPAQEIQILNNPNNSEISPWYSGRFNSDLLTPEWSFEVNNLKSF